MIKPPEQTAKDLVLEVDNIINPNKENKVNKGNWDYEKARELALFFVRKLLENNLLEPQQYKTFKLWQKIQKNT